MQIDPKERHEVVHDCSLSAILEGMGQTKSPCKMFFIVICKAINKTLSTMIFLSIRIHFSILFSLLLLSLRQGLQVPWRPMSQGISTLKNSVKVLLFPSMSSCKMASLPHNHYSHFHSEVDIR